MSDLVLIAFPAEAKAEEVRQNLQAMQKECLIELGDAVVAVDAQGLSGIVERNVARAPASSSSDQRRRRLVSTTSSRPTWALRLSLSIRTVLNTAPHSARRPPPDGYFLCL
jgi:hypothetical protein